MPNYNLNARCIMYWSLKDNAWVHFQSLSDTAKLIDGDETIMICLRSGPNIDKKKELFNPIITAAPAGSSSRLPKPSDIANALSRGSSRSYSDDSFQAGGGEENVTKISTNISKRATDVASFAAKSTQEAGKLLSGWAMKGLSFTKDTLSQGLSETFTSGQDIIKVGEKTIFIERKLAQGGFSEVFIGKDQSTGEIYALKRCVAQSEEAYKLLEQEANLGKIIKNKNVLKLIDYDIKRHETLNHAKRVDMLFPLCSGGSISDRIDFGKSSIDSIVAIELFKGICKGVQAVHDAGFIHRDIKPHNVLLMGIDKSDPDLLRATPVLMDLGSACLYPVKIPDRKSASLIADEASMLCSAPYRAPELYEPEKGMDIDAEADIWSLGCTLYAMTFGKGYSPFEDPNQGVSKLAVLNGGPVRYPMELDENEEVIKDIIDECLKAQKSRIDLLQLISKLDSI